MRRHSSSSSGSLAGLIAAARRVSATADPEGAFDADAVQVEALLTAVRNLYQAMGPSLRLPVQGQH